MHIIIESALSRGGIVSIPVIATDIRIEQKGDATPVLVLRCLETFLARIKIGQTASCLYECLFSNTALEKNKWTLIDRAESSLSPPSSLHKSFHNSRRDVGQIFSSPSH